MFSPFYPARIVELFRGAVLVLLTQLSLFFLKDTYFLVKCIDRPNCNSLYLFIFYFQINLMGGTVMFGGALLPTSLAPMVLSLPRLSSLIQSSSCRDWSNYGNSLFFLHFYDQSIPGSAIMICFVPSDIEISDFFLYV